MTPIAKKTIPKIDRTKYCTIRKKCPQQSLARHPQFGGAIFGNSSSSPAGTEEFFEPTLLHQLTRMGYSWVAEPFEGGLWPTQVWDAIFGRRQKGERPSCLFYLCCSIKITTSAQTSNNVAQVISPNGLYIPTSLKGKLVYPHAVSLVFDNL